MVRLAARRGAAARGDPVTSPPIAEFAPEPAPAVSEAAQRVAALVGARITDGDAFFSAEAMRIARLCANMADRFARGGRLIAVGSTPAARSDVRHVAVEFVHPVIVGKRALPAFGIMADGGEINDRVALLVSSDDIVLAFGACDEALPLEAAIATARARGCLTIADGVVGADVEFRAPTTDAFTWQELVETLYHVLWELVHVFFEHEGKRGSVEAHHPGGAAFLYPFLTGGSADLETIMEDVARSVLMKARESADLRRRTVLADHGEIILRAAALARQRLDAGGTVLAFGNGGSATDAMDIVADMRTPPRELRFAPRRALDLTDDSAILTALANDVSTDVLFARQIIAYGTARDVAIGFSTSGSSRNVIAAFEEARRRDLLTIAFVGYDGGRIAAERLADYVVVTPSQYVPRIQEAQATAYHLLRTLVG